MQKKAYSLIEISVVIVIIAILISGGLSALTGSANNARAKVTRDRMTEIYKAMGNYLLINKALPCPASIIDIKSTSTTYGIAGTAPGACNAGAGVYVGASGHSAQLAYGMVPVQTLGLPIEMGEDGFGSKFTYIVSKGFTDPSWTSTSSGFGSIFPATGFSTATSGFITMKENLGSGAYQVNSYDTIFVIISHGVNKYGAFDSNSAIQNPASPDADEQLNYGATTSFYPSPYYFVSTAINSDTFDDIVLYKTRNSMVADYEAFSLIACPATSGSTPGADDLTITYGASNPTFSWPISGYNQIVPANSSQACPVDYQVRVKYPTRRCGTYGVWESDVIHPCSNI